MGQTFEVTLPSELAKQPLDGRLLLMLSKNPTGEPRFQISDGQETQQILGVDVNEWKPGTTVKVGVNAVGYPLETINKIKSGQYSVQALLHVLRNIQQKRWACGKTAHGQRGRTTLEHGARQYIFTACCSEF